MICKECKEEKREAAKGLCSTCYSRKQREKNAAVCLGCVELKPIHAKGLCNKCYGRFRRHGDTSQVRKKKDGTLCSYCHERPVHAKGFCSSCYSRYLSNGSPVKVKVKKFQVCKHCGVMGKIKAKGYCNNCYTRSLRHKDGNPNIIKKKQVKACLYCKKVTTIKAKGYCTVCYQRVKKTGSPEYTKVVHYCKVVGCQKPTASHGYCDTHRDRFVDKRKNTNTHLKRKFGITIDDYEKMYENQEGVCKICGEVETVVQFGRVNNLSVDHCHKTGKIRGLLCNNCNIALGGFKDSKELLTKAINYLHQHKE